MAEDGSGEKTEDATPRRKEDARKEGNVAKGKEISQAFTLLASFLLLYFLMQQMFFTMITEIRYYFTELITSPFSIDNAYNILLTAFMKAIRAISPVMVVTAAAGVLVNFLQIGPLFTTKSLVPDLKKINPIKGFKNIFSLRSLMELFKSLFKLAIISAIAYNILVKNIEVFQKTLHQGLRQSLVVISDLISTMAFSIITAIMVLGIIDLIYQRWQHNKDLRMSKYEVKQERKEMEGDPMIRQQRKQKQKEMSMNRMMSSVQEADVVITNPTHIAVALKYDLDEMEAPVVLAKGEGFVAQKIKDRARESEIEIIENKPLARSLNSMTEIGDQVPVELYQAVAEILAKVFKEKDNY